MDTVPITAQEQPQKENTHQEESAPQTADTLEPIEKPTEDIPSETVHAKTKDMVDFTFRQLMMQAGVDTIADAGFRCNVCIIENGGSLLTYVLYDG